MFNKTCHKAAAQRCRCQHAGVLMFVYIFRENYYSKNPKCLLVLQCFSVTLNNQ